MPPPMTPVRDRSGDGKVRIASSSSSTVSTPSKTGVDVVTYVYTFFFGGYQSY